MHNRSASPRPKGGRWLLLSFLSAVCFAPAAYANRLETFLFDVTQSRIEFATEGGIEPRGQIITNPTRLVIDLPGAVFKGRTVRRNIGSAVQAVRVGQVNAETTRLVVEFAPDFPLDAQQLRLSPLSASRWSVQLPQTVAAASVNRAAEFVWPVIGELTAGFGWRVHPIDKQRRFHKGIDIAAPLGTPIQAASDGVVSDTGWDAGGYGNYVELTHANGSKTFYAHANRLYVSKGQSVKQGQAIAEVGSTGRSTGPHLHFEVQPDGSQVEDPMARLPLRYILFDVAAL